MATRMPSVHAAVLTAVALGLVTSLAAQTVVKPPKNRYTPEQDVQLGKEAAAEVRKQYPDHRRRADHALSHGSGRSAGGQRPAAS